jgi:hypothetical protein
MWAHPKTADRLNLMAEQIRLAQAVTPDLVSYVIVRACARLAALRRTGNVARLNRLIEAGAWTEVALALIELELPQWTLRRLSMMTANGCALFPGSPICRWSSTTQ